MLASEGSTTGSPLSVLFNLQLWLPRNYISVMDDSSLHVCYASPTRIPSGGFQVSFSSLYAHCFQKQFQSLFVCLQLTPMEFHAILFLWVRQLEGREGKIEFMMSLSQHQDIPLLFSDSDKEKSLSNETDQEFPIQCLVLFSLYYFDIINNPILGVYFLFFYVDLNI